jgi:hypothetical protein
MAIEHRFSCEYIFGDLMIKSITSRNNDFPKVILFIIKSPKILLDINIIFKKVIEGMIPIWKRIR